MSAEIAIEPYLRDVDILQQTAAQIKKDFSFFSLEVIFTGNGESAFRELSDQILPHIARLMKEDYPQFLSLLYRIDLKESLLSQRPPDRKPEEYITELIIKRSLQKVILRKLYS